MLVIGAIMVSAAAWLVSPILALFVMGVSLIAGGVWVAKGERRRV